jgi:hypothetical protein
MNGEDLVEITFIMNPDDFNNLRAIDFAFFRGEAIRLVRGIKGQKIDLIKNDQGKVMKVKVQVQEKLKREVVALFKSFGWKTKNNEEQKSKERSRK